ncbi:MAG: NAD/NADP octopine/nopaline dehydrogenase family protein [Deltaproteobacteria bacterium]|nr:NAD/NADP octopine/nopaline dehydrogenase family protein [Deltaproteobacteria bacterium]MBW2670150.1 NAD/NADP octopine/nopaline dehydrogenase family protein [Deltaproteobacteria bacterium]
MDSMKVAVMGGGNGSHTIAADLALKGLTVNMFEVEQFAAPMREVFETREIEMSGVAGRGIAKLNLVTTNIRAAIEDVEVVFIPLPGFTVSIYGQLLAPYLTKDQIVVIMPGTLSALEFREALRANGNHIDPIIAETGGLPFATRLVGPGKVKTFHVRSVCGLAAIPGNKGKIVYEKLKGLYPFDLKNSVVETGLGHLTPLLHPVGCLLNAGRIERSHGEFYMYEEGMTPSVVRVIESLDRERLKIGEALGIQLPTGVDMMVESGYGPRGTLWESLNGSAGLTPVKGPDSLENRYVTEDIPFGLVAWASLGNATGMDTPIMDSLVEIGSAIMGKNCWKEGRNLEKMGLAGLNIKQIKAFLEDGKSIPS